MQGPFFVRKGDKYVPADICADCGWYDEKQKDCVMHNCPFVPDYSEDEEVKTEE